jgi:hypothetical protein
LTEEPLPPPNILVISRWIDLPESADPLDGTEDSVPISATTVNLGGSIEKPGCEEKKRTKIQ